MGKYHSNKHNHIYAGQNKVHAIKLQKVKFTNTISKDLHITHYSNIVIYKSMLISVGKNLHLHWNCCSDSVSTLGDIIPCNSKNNSMRYNIRQITPIGFSKTVGTNL